MSYRDYSFYVKLIRRWRRKNGGTMRSSTFEPTRGYLKNDADSTSSTGAKNNSGIWRLEEVHTAISDIIPIGEHRYTTPGTYTWVAPAGVTSVTILVVGAGGGTTGGALGYKNNRAVTPGASYQIRAGLGGTSRGGGQGGNAGESSYFKNSDGSGDTTAQGGPARIGNGSTTAATRSGDTDGGGNGGRHTSNGGGYTGTGAGGYSGNGGNYANAGGSFQAGSGGGGASANWAYNSGGGVGIYGEGASGTSARAGGSGGSNGGASSAGGTHGGGASANPAGLRGGAGAVRILWGEGRAFPSTLVDLASSDGNVSTN